MSIVSMALRLSARRLIEANVLEGTRVFDSALAPIGDMIGSEPRPFIVVASEDQRSTITGRDVNGGQSAMDLVVEIVHAAERQFTTEDGEGVETVVQVPNTDAGLEFINEITQRQVIRALLEGPEPWGSIFKRLSPSITQINVRRGGGAEGARFAARQIVITIEPLNEPGFGALPAGGTPLADFLAAMEADADFAPLVPAVRSAIIGEPIANWRQPAATLGLTDSEARALGVMPIIDPGEAPVEIVEAALFGIGSANAEVIERNLPDAS